MARALRVGILSRLNALDPHAARESVTTLAVAQVFEPPFQAPRGDGPAAPVLFEGPLERVGGSASSWSGTWRKGLVFSDGTPLTAGLAAVSLGRSLKEHHARVDVDADRLLFTLDVPNPRFDLTLSLVSCGLTLEKGGQVLGTGAYMPAPGVTLEAMRLVRNPHARAAASIEEIAFAVYPPDADGRPEALLRAIAAGEVDFTHMLSRSDATAVSGVKKLFQPSSAVAVLYFNTERPALQAAPVRRALAMSVDRMAITEISYANPLAFMATSLLPPTLGAARDEIPFDPEKAKAQLATGRGTGRLELLVVWAPRPYLPNPQPVAEMIARQLANVGVDVQVSVARNSDEYFRRIERGDYDMVLGGWIADTPNPADFLETNLRSDRVQTPGSTMASANKARFRSPAMDEALARFRADPSSENRSALLRLLADEAPLLPLMYGPTVVVHTWTLKGLQLSSLGVPDFATATLED